jgi:sodium/proline symporter
MEFLQNSASNTFVFFTIVVYFTGLMYLGYRGFRRTKTFSDYILGSRKLGPIVGAMNVGASDMSSWLLMGLPGAFYVHGVNQVWMVIGLIVGSYCSWKIIAKRLRRYTEISGDALTISSFLENRFEDKTRILNVVTLIVIIFFFTIYISAGFVASAKLFSEMFGVSYLTVLWISCICIVSYALLGGFLAVSYADLFQGILIFCVLLFVPVFIVYNSDFSASDYIAKTIAMDPSHANPFYELNLVGILGFFAWGLGYFGQPHIISKYMAIKDPHRIDLARKICISWMSLSMVGAAAIGLLGFVYFADNPLKEPETVFITMSHTIFHPIVIGILVAAILSAIMSTTNAQIIICCSALSEDLYRRFIRKNAANKEMLFVTRMWVVLVALVAMFIAADQSSSVLALVAKAWAGLGAAFGPIVLFALFWKKATRSGAIAGVVSGALGAIIFSKLSFISYEILPAFLFSSFMIFVVSLMTQKQVPHKVVADFKRLNEMGSAIN